MLRDTVLIPSNANLGLQLFESLTVFIKEIVDPDQCGSEQIQLFYVYNLVNKGKVFTQ